MITLFKKHVDFIVHYDYRCWCGGRVYSCGKTWHFLLMQEREYDGKKKKKTQLKHKTWKVCCTRLIGNQVVQSFGNRELGTGDIGEVNNHQKILQMRVEHLFEWCIIQLGNDRYSIHDITTNSIVGLLLSSLRAWTMMNIIPSIPILLPYQNTFNIFTDSLQKFL